MSFEFCQLENDEGRIDLLDIYDEYEECNFDENCSVIDYDRDK